MALSRNPLLNDLLAQANIQLIQADLDVVEERILNWTLTLDSLKVHSEKIKNILAKNRKEYEPQEANQLFDWLIEKGLQDINSNYTEKAHILRCLDEIIPENKIKELSGLILQETIEVIVHNINLIRGDTLYDQNFEDNLTRLCKQRLSREFMENLKSFISNEFFLLSPANRLKMLNDSRHNNNFLQVLTGHEEAGDTAIFLKRSLEDNIELIKSLNTNRLGQNFIPTKDFLARRLANFMMMELNDFTKELADFLIKKPNIFLRTADKKISQLLDMLVKDKDFAAFMIHHKIAAGYFLLKCTTGDSQLLENLSKHRIGQHICTEFRSNASMSFIIEKHNISANLFEDFICPITSCFIFDNVIKILKSNRQYQYFSQPDIKKWVDQSHTNPFTRQPLEQEQLIKATDEYRKNFLEVLKKALKEKGHSPEIIKDKTIEIFDKLDWKHPEKVEETPAPCPTLSFRLSNIR